MYKSKLQQLCQQNMWPLPKYSNLRDGPDHCPSFKASVLVNDCFFESVSAYKSSKDAQNDAAMRAFFQLESLHHSDMELVEDVAVKPEEKNKIFPGYIKNLLQELAQKEGLSLPKYKTAQMQQLFYSTVDVGGVIFQGKAAKSKKVSEVYAAQVAYRSLEQHARQIDNFVSADSLKTPLDVVIQGKMVELSDADSDGSNHTTCQSYLLNNRVRVYTTIPDIEFPKGVTLIPIADSKWVPVGLEFPNNTGI